MFVSYEFKCRDCKRVETILVDKEDRNNPLQCKHCKTGEMHRIFSVPNIRTPKTSVSFLDPTTAGGGRPDKGWADLKRAAELRVEQTKHKPGSVRHSELGREIKERERIK